MDKWDEEEKQRTDETKIRLTIIELTPEQRARLHKSMQEWIKKLRG